MTKQQAIEKKPEGIQTSTVSEQSALSAGRIAPSTSGAFKPYSNTNSDPFSLKQKLSGKYNNSNTTFNLDHKHLIDALNAALQRQQT